MTNTELAKCRHCGHNVGAVKLTEPEEVFHFGHVLTEVERGYCSQQCMREAMTG